MDIIKVGERNYVVTELKSRWKLTDKTAKLTVDFVVDKELCPTLEALKAYAENNFRTN